MDYLIKKEEDYYFAPLYHEKQLALFHFLSPLFRSNRNLHTQGDIITWIYYWLRYNNLGYKSDGQNKIYKCNMYSGPHMGCISGEGNMHQVVGTIGVYEYKTKIPNISVLEPTAYLSGLQMEEYAKKFPELDDINTEDPCFLQAGVYAIGLSPDRILVQGPKLIATESEIGWRLEKN